jgi:hypothetical protein
VNDSSLRRYGSSLNQDITIFLLYCFSWEEAKINLLQTCSIKNDYQLCLQEKKT